MRHAVETVVIENQVTRASEDVVIGVVPEECQRLQAVVRNGRAAAVDIDGAGDHQVRGIAVLGDAGDVAADPRGNGGSAVGGAGIGDGAGVVHQAVDPHTHTNAIVDKGKVAGTRDTAADREPAVSIIPKCGRAVEDDRGVDGVVLIVSSEHEDAGLGPAATDRQWSLHRVGHRGPVVGEVNRRPAGGVGHLIGRGRRADNVIQLSGNEAGRHRRSAKGNHLAILHSGSAVGEGIRRVVGRHAGVVLHQRRIEGDADVVFEGDAAGGLESRKRDRARREKAARRKHQVVYVGGAGLGSAAGAGRVGVPIEVGPVPSAVDRDSHVGRVLVEIPVKGGGVRSLRGKQ